MYIYIYNFYIANFWYIILESKKRKEEKLLKWKSIKCACQTYKQYLDFRIRLINSKEQEQIKVSFFINDTDIKDEYFVLLLNHNDQWKGMTFVFKNYKCIIWINCL